MSCCCRRWMVVGTPRCCSDGDAALLTANRKDRFASFNKFKFFFCFCLFSLDSVEIPKCQGGSKILTFARSTKFGNIFQCSILANVFATLTPNLYHGTHPSPGTTSLSKVGSSVLGSESPFYHHLRKSFRSWNSKSSHGAAFVQR